VVFGLVEADVSELGIGPEQARGFSAVAGMDLFRSLLDLHGTVDRASAALAPLAPELAALHDREVECWGITGASACEVAKGLAGRVLREARSAAGLGGERLLWGYDVPVLIAKAEDIVRRLAALPLPETKALVSWVTREVGQAASARRELLCRTRAEAGQPDELIEPDTLRWGGRLYRFSRLAFLLLTCLWGGKAIPVGDLLEEIYGDDYDKKEDALKQVANRLNKEAAKNVLPFKARQSAGHWKLHRLPPLSADGR
jgi:hypothetical protein